MIHFYRNHDLPRGTPRMMLVVDGHDEWHHLVGPDPEQIIKDLDGPLNIESCSGDAIDMELLDSAQNNPEVDDE